MYIKPIFTVICSLIAVTLVAYPYFDVQVPSEGAGGGNIVCRIYIPVGAPRYEEGAPVVVFVPGAQSVGDLRRGLLYPVEEGMMVVLFLFPGGVDPSTGIASDGMYDYRGMNCMKALRDVLKFAAGRKPSADGRYIYEYVPFRVDTSNVGIFGNSNGGVISIAVMDQFGAELDFVDYIVGWENPTSSQTVVVDLGQRDRDTLHDGDGNGFYDDDYKNYSYIAYGDTTCVVDYSTIAFDPTYTYEPRFPKGAIFLDRYNPDSNRYDYVEVDGYRWPDVTGNYMVDSTEDYLFACIPYIHGGDTLYIFSREVIHALAEYGVFHDGFPDWLATPYDADTFWYWRDATLHYDGLPPWLHCILLASQNDHVQSAPDKPHIHHTFNGFTRNGLWIRLNPDREYIVYLDSTVVDSSLPDNDAWSAPGDWDSIIHYCYPEYLDEKLVKTAAILEAADRTHYNEWGVNLPHVLHVTPKATLMFNIVLHYEEYNRYLIPQYLLQTTNTIRRLVDSLAAHGAKASLQLDWTIVEGIKLYDPSLIPYVESRGSEIATHAHETVYSGAEIKRMLDELGAVNTRHGNGHFLGAYFDEYWYEVANVLHVSLNKNIYTQYAVTERIHPWRPLTDSLDNRGWLTHNPDGKVVYTTSAGIPAMFMAPHRVAAFMVGTFAKCDTSYVNCTSSFIGAVDPNEQPLVDSVAAFLREVSDMLVADGWLTWATMDEIYNTYVDWETTHPGMLPYDDTLRVDPGDTNHYSVPEGWTFYTMCGDSTAGEAVLSSNIVTCMVQDTAANIWVGTTGGINIFHDGVWYWIRKNEGLPGNFVKCMTVDKVHGVIWAGIDGYGIVGLDYDGNVIAHYDTTNSGISSNFVHAIIVDGGGNLFIGTFGGGLNILDSLGGWHVYNTGNSMLPDDDVFALEFDNLNRLYIGTSGGGLAYMDGWGNIIPIEPPDTAHKVFNYVHALKWHNGKLWIGTFGGGVLTYDGANWEIYTPYLGDARGNEVHQAGLVFLGDTLLVASYKNDIDGLTLDGVWLYNFIDIPSNGIAGVFTEVPTAIVVDTIRNHLWVGTVRGVKVFDLDYLHADEGITGHKFINITIQFNRLRFSNMDELKVFDITGKLLYEGHEITEVKLNLPSGIYFVLGKTEGDKINQKIVLIK